MRRKRKVLGATTQWVHRACYPNHVWGYDFVFDQSEDARQLKCLTVVDEFTRQGLWQAQDLWSTHSVRDFGC
jgi:putative transposase